jgi:hypothetical protein
MLLIIVDFVALTVFLLFQQGSSTASGGGDSGNSLVYSYMSIGCIIVFIMSFAIGLGPIP